MLTPECICGKPIYFKYKQRERECPWCGVPCRRDYAGYWSKGLNTVLFTPKDKFLAKKGAM